MKGKLDRFWLLLACMALILGGCTGENNNTETLGTNPFVTEGNTQTVFALFDPGPRIMPLPNDVVWMADGEPQVELAPDPDDSPDMVALKALIEAQGLLGLSPNMFLTVPVSGAVDASTLDILVFRTDDPQLPVLLTALATNDLAGAGAALAQMEIRTRNDFVVVPGQGIIKLLPKTPFTPGVRYVAVIPDTLTDADGFQVASSITMQALKSRESFTPDHPFFRLEALRAGFNDSVGGNPSLFQVVQGVSGAVHQNTGLTRDDVLVLWTFHTAASTLSLTPTTAGSETVDYPGGTNPFSGTAAALKGLTGAFGTLFGDNQLAWLNLSGGTPVPSATPVGIPAAALLNGTGIPTGNLGNIFFGLFRSPDMATQGQTPNTVPFLITVPNAVAPAAGHPVVVFQHGITSDKTASLAIADSLAAAGFAVLAIDAPLHGDRTTAGAESGDGFFSTNLLQSRANVYQSAVDLWETLDVITAGIDLDAVPDGIADLDANRIQFIGHSLGSIIGSVFLSQETRTNRMILSSPSAMLVNVLDETFLPDMQALVGSLGFTPGSTEYFVFLNVAQWLMDPVDSAYNGIGANGNGNLLSVFAFGDPIVSTASTEVFLTNLGIDPSSATSVDPDDTVTPGVSPAPLAGAYEYGVAGQPIVHSFLLSPLFDPVTEPYYEGYSAQDQLSATTASQTQAAGFLAAP